MSKAIEDWYRATQKLIKGVSDHKTSETDEMIKEWEEALSTMEVACPGLKENYERRKAVQESFTPEQIDFICYQIGDWYIDWKDRMATGTGKQHRLGIAKEHLKTMICGD